jgi:hypothetical protein
MPIFSSTAQSLGQIMSTRRNNVLPYLVRQVLTIGYVAAGYKDGIAWRNVNSYTFSNDTASNLGDLLQEAGNYTKGAQNKNTAYVFSTNGTGNQGVGAYTSTSCFNMRNNTSMTKNNNMNMNQTMGDGSTIQSTDLQGNYVNAYANGNMASAIIQKFNMSSETYSNNISTGFAQGGTGAGAHWSETFGYWWGDSADTDASYRKKFVFATDTESTPSTAPGGHGQQKGQVAKTGYGYAGRDGGYGSNRYWRKWNYSTEVSVGDYQKAVWYCGEENYTTSQTHGIMLGAYSEATGGNQSGTGQTNDIGKYDYSTDSGSRLTSTSLGGTATGTGSNGAAIGGRSSGVGFWRD